jgi:hypothetical protein
MDDISLIEEQLRNPSNVGYIAVSSSYRKVEKFYFVEIKNKYKGDRGRYYFKEEEYDTVQDMIEKYRKIHKDAAEKKKNDAKIKREAQKSAEQNEEPTKALPEEPKEDSTEEIETEEDDMEEIKDVNVEEIEDQKILHKFMGKYKSNLDPVEEPISLENNSLPLEDDTTED